MRPSEILTADVIAHAIVASAKAYGDDPVRVLLSRGGPTRRCITPAAEALCLLTGYSYAKLAPVLQIAPRGTSRARLNGGDAYERAFEAAEARLRELGLQRSSFPPLKEESAAPAPLAAAPAEPAATRVAPETATTPAYAAGDLAALVARRLGDGPSSARTLALHLNAPECEILEALSALEADGKVRPGAPGRAWDRIWQLAPQEWAQRPHTGVRLAS